MEKVITSERIPIKLWLDDIEKGALDQAKNLANLPFAYKHIAIMPDSHVGYGMPIGGVMAAKGYIIPNAVGVDIGCGMCAVRTSLQEADPDLLKHVMQIIRSTIPVGFNSHDSMQDIPMMEPASKESEIIHELWPHALTQAGTLGSGNHFIEIQKGDDGFVWIMIHSGSRGLGFKVAKHYNKMAIDLNERYFSAVGTKQGLAFLPFNDDIGRQYYDDMLFCTEFAYHNRRLMLDRVQYALMYVYGDVTFEKEINLPHNYAAFEHHFGQNVLIHRKGATSAKEDEIGIVPGSQGTSSYIVRGKGNQESFMSCSHGAGRRMGRNEAKRKLSLDDEVKRLDKLGVIHAVRHIDDLDEAPGAYKDINEVMANQVDLVNIEVELKPLAVVKG